MKLEKDSESDLDNSESSLEGSFKQLNANSRSSTISSDGDSDDFDDIPRFSLPFRKSDVQNFYTKRTELRDEVSSKEWSWKNAETEISWKCTRRGRNFHSEEHGMQGAFGISKDILPRDFGNPEDVLPDDLKIPENTLPKDLKIPKDLLRDFNLIALQTENTTTDVESCNQC